MVDHLARCFELESIVTLIVALIILVMLRQLYYIVQRLAPNGFWYLPKTSPQSGMWHKAGFYVWRFRIRRLEQKILLGPAYTGSDLFTSPDERLPARIAPSRFLSA